MAAGSAGRPRDAQSGLASHRRAQRQTSGRRSVHAGRAGHARRALDQRAFALWARFDWPEAAVQRRLLALGLPIGLSLLLQSGLFTVIALLIGRLGSPAVAAHQVALNVCGLVFTVPAGLAMALAVRVGHAAGRGDARAVRRIGTTGR